MFQKRSKVLFVANVIATLYGVYLMSYFGEATTTDIGGAIATALVTPHMLMVVLGAVFGWIGFFARKAWGAMVGAILYCVAAVMFLMYAMFTIPMIVLGFIGYAKQKKLNNIVDASVEAVIE